VNYRRNDSEGEAGRLFDDMALNFSQDVVFMDVAAIEPGQDFRKAIDKSVATCSVLLAVIGPQWLDARDGAGARRLEDPGDFVRIELASALTRQVMIVPVLVRGARMPRPEELPDDLKDLAYRNAVELTHARWKSDIQVLVRALRPYMTGPAVTSSSSSVKQSIPVVAEETASKQALAPVNDFGSLASTDMDRRELERVVRELATYLGPIANMVVKRASKQCNSIAELCSTVAREIVSDTDRARFLRSCRG
jgi:hypothetical protein